MIGIIGGVGPTAGADLLQKITEETTAGKDQEHLPVILFSFPHLIDDRTEYLEGRVKNNPGDAIAKIAFQLNDLGVNIAAIPCNTAHAPAIFNKVTDELEKAGKKLKLVNLIDESIKYLESNFDKGGGIGVLSTTGTYKQKIYSSRIEEAGFKPIIPTEDIQKELVHNAIYHTAYGIKSKNGKTTKLARAQLEFAMDLLKEQGAEAIILGCTELPLAFEECKYKDMLLIDATRLLARGMIREFDKTKLREDSYSKELNK